jgi:hypothetical protein
MLYEAVTGVMDQDYALRVLGGTPVSARTLNPSLERDVATLCTDLLQPDPAKRAGAKRVFKVLSKYQRASAIALSGDRR